MFDQRSLEYFLAVVDHGSVSAAAAACHVTQPAVSRQLSKLERRVGSPLFHRSSSGMVLTGIGLRVEPLARDLLTRTHRAEDVVASLGDGTPRFIAACPETTANFFVAPFVAANGGIRDVLPLHPGDVYGALERGADLAINTSPPPARYVGITAAEVPIVAQYRPDAAPPEADTPGAPLELAELVNQPFFMPGHGSAVERHVLEASAQAELNLAWAGSTSNATFAQARAAAGHGWAVCIEPQRFGLRSRPLHANGRQLTVGMYVAWDPEHYAAREMANVAASLARWIAASELTGAGRSQVEENGEARAL